jgi:hypothetical protein
MSSPTTFSIFIAIILASIVIVSKLRKTLRGSKVRQKPLIAITLVQLGLTSYFVLSSLFIGIPIIFLILYAILFILAQFISYRYSDRVLSFWSTPDGSVFWKGGLYIHLVYIVSFVIRSAISLFLLGSGLFRFDIIQTARLAGQGAALNLLFILPMNC